MSARTLFEKIWHAHEVLPETADTPAVIAIDLHLTHEVTTPQAFALLKPRGLRVRRPEGTLATLDHAVPTDSAQVFRGTQIGELERNAREYGFELLGLCDSHTSRHDAFGTLAFGIGTTEVTHMLATQCLLQRKPRTLAITVEGSLGAGVGAKDLVLAIIGRIGVASGEVRLPGDRAAPFQVDPFVATAC